MIMENDWIKVDQSHVDKPALVSFKGGTIQVRVSPYDLPEAFRGYWKVPGERFVIEFRYMSSDESLLTESPDTVASFHIGKSSRRVYAIELDMKELRRQADRQHSSITEGVVRRVRDIGKRFETRSASYDVAGELLLENPSLIPA